MKTKYLMNENQEHLNIAYIRELGGTGTNYEIGNAPFYIGRGEDNDLSCEDPFLSQRHCRILSSNGRYYIRDLDSSNGTSINGVPIREAELKDQDLVKIGELTLSFNKTRVKSSKKLSTRSLNPHWNFQLKRIPNFADSPFPVLINGPSGTGKEIIANMIHEYSPRRSEPFVSVNCSALSESLIESELFGHVKGAFTGAETSRKGAFEAARKGTLFLDEIGDLPKSLQPKLLRALENNEIRPVGSDKTIKTDIRIVAATHHKLQEKVINGEFREDLFFRLNVLNVETPKLSERMEDFESLVYQFCKEYRISFSVDAIQILAKKEWPGNIRELKNLIAKCSVLFKGSKVKPKDLEKLNLFSQNFKNDKTNFGEIKSMGIREMEKQLIYEALIKFSGNQKRAAEQLQIPKSTMHDKIKQYGINVKLLKEGHLKVL